MAIGDWDRAIADYGLAIAFDSRMVTAYYNRGMARRRKGDLAGALEDFSRVIELNPRHAGAYINRGMISYGLGQLDVAISDFGRAIEIDPGDALAWNNRGKARGDSGDLAGAIADFDRAVSSTRATPSSGPTAAVSITCAARWNRRSPIATGRSGWTPATPAPGTAAGWRDGKRAILMARWRISAAPSRSLRSRRDSIVIAA